MQTINRTIASVAAKLTRQFFAANPNTEKTLSEVQREMRKEAIAQLEAERLNPVLDKIAQGEAAQDSQDMTFEAAIAEIDTMNGDRTRFIEWFESAKSVIVMSRKKDGAVVVGAKINKNPKYTTLIDLTFENGKKGIVMSTAKEMKRLYNFSAAK